jgi:protein NrfD
MPETLPSTFFTESPHWSLIIALYFFLGGIAGGSFFIAALLDMVGRPADRPIVRLGYYIAFPAIILGTILLTVDLGRPERFWHMMFESQTGRPMFKAWSPISFGTWAIFVFTILSFLTFLRALVEDGYVRAGGLARAMTRLPWAIIGIVGGLLGLFIASYTGFVLAVTNRPIWADTNLIGALFVLSAASTSAALLILLGSGNRAVTPASVHRLARMETWTSVLELITLVVLIISLGSVARVWLSAWGVVLVVGVVILGMLVPMWLHTRPRPIGAAGVRTGATAAALAVLGGLLLRIVIVMSSEGVPHGG